MLSGVRWETEKKKTGRERGRWGKGRVGEGKAREWGTERAVNRWRGNERERERGETTRERREKDAEWERKRQRVGREREWEKDRGWEWLRQKVGDSGRNRENRIEVKIEEEREIKRQGKWKSESAKMLTLCSRCYHFLNTPPWNKEELEYNWLWSHSRRDSISIILFLMFSRHQYATCDKAYSIHWYRKAIGICFKKCASLLQ